LAYNNAARFLVAWNTAPTDQAKNNLKQEAVNRSPAHDVQFAAMLKINLQLQASVGQLTHQVRARWPRLTYLPGRLRLPMVLQTWIVSDLRRLPSIGTERRASMWIIGFQSSRIIFELLPARITSGWHPLIWRVGPVPCGQMSTRRTRGQMVGSSPLTLLHFSREMLEANYGLEDPDQKY
jgi:hypothetical protein